MPAVAFAREATSTYVQNLQSAVLGAEFASLAPLIERIFRYSWLLATERCDTMVREGCKDEVDALVAGGRALHDKLNRAGSKGAWAVKSVGPRSLCGGWHRGDHWQIHGKLPVRQRPSRNSPHRCTPDRLALVLEASRIARPIAQSAD